MIRQKTFYMWVANTFWQFWHSLIFTPLSFFSSEGVWNSKFNRTHSLCIIEGLSHKRQQVATLWHVLPFFDYFRTRTPILKAQWFNWILECQCAALCLWGDSIYFKIWWLKFQKLQVQGKLEEQLKTKNKELADFQTKYKIRLRSGNEDETSSTKTAPAITAWEYSIYCVALSHNCVYLLIVFVDDLVQACLALFEIWMGEFANNFRKMGHPMRMDPPL